MHRGRGGRSPFSDLGDPFGSFGTFGDPFAGFGSFGGSVGSGGPRSLISSFFGGRDPFDDPFFTQPFGGMFGSSFFGQGQSPFSDMHSTPMIAQQPAESKRSKGPIIEELDSDEEEEAEQYPRGNPKKHGRHSSEPYVEDPEDEADERKNRRVQLRPEHDWMNQLPTQPHSRSFSFQSSSITYGGANGAYYTSSKTRRTGSDGVTIEESKEADSASREATHRMSRALHNKGHTVTRNLKSDGRVNTMQTLHNINQDELAGFERAWDRSFGKQMPGWPGSLGGSIDMGSVPGGQGSRQASQKGWALPGATGSAGYGGQGSQALPENEPSQPKHRPMHGSKIRAGPSHESGRRKAPVGAGYRGDDSHGKTKN